MQEVLTNIKDDRLRVYMIWLPIFPGDSRQHAQNRSNEFKDERLSYFWDENQITGKQWQSVLDIERIAWDVYFLYGAEAHWKEQPSQPNFWMHQLSGVNAAPFLNPTEFESKTRELLKTLDILK